jgi:hypothetical protein
MAGIFHVAEAGVMSSSGLFRRLTAVAMLCVLAVATGCGKKDPFGRQPLKGFVTWEGKPIKIGTISLEPAEGQAAGAFAPIRDGAFDIPRSAGPCPGRYNVWLHAYDHTGEQPADGSEIAPPKEILPPKFLAKPPAQITIEEVEGEQVNEFTFDLK